MQSKFNMKKLSLILLVVMVGSFVLAGLTLSVTGGVSAIFSGEGEEKGIDQEKSFDIEGIDTINIDATSTDIYLIPTDGDELTAKLHGNVSSVSLKPKHELKGKKSSDSIDIGVKVKRKVYFTLFYSSRNLRLDIYVPRDYDKDIFIDTTSSDVSIKNLTLNTLNNDTTSGDLIIDNVSTNSTILDTTSGDIIVKDLNGELTIESVSGDIEATNFDGNVDIKTTSADIDISYENYNNDINIKTVSGDIEMNLDEDSEFYLISKTLSGDINCDFPISIKSTNKNSLEGSVGSSDNNIMIKTVSGDVEIRK